MVSDRQSQRVAGRAVIVGALWYRRGRFNVAGFGPNFVRSSVVLLTSRFEA